HLIRTSLKYVPRREREQVARDLKPIYTAVDADQAQAELEAFDEKWGARFPPITQAWLNAWEYVIPFLAFPDEVRRVIYTTDESVNAACRYSDSVRVVVCACGGAGGVARRQGCRRNQARTSDLPGAGACRILVARRRLFAAGCQLALGCGVGVVDPRAKRRFWD